MVAEIDKSVDAAERNPQRFNLSQAEVSDRRRWVMSTRRQLSRCALQRMPAMLKDARPRVRYRLRLLAGLPIRNYSAHMDRCLHAA